VKNELPKKDHVLIISHEPQLLAEIKMELLPSFEISMSAASGSAIHALEAYEIAAIVICIGENSAKAFADFHDIFEIVKSRSIPILFIAERGNDHDETAAFAMGAVDYSARRRGTIEALTNRIRLRINASEHERMLLAREDTVEPPSDIKEIEKSLAGKTLLVVDDVLLNREFIKAMLSEVEGLDMDFAGNGLEAVEKFKKEPDRFSLILMDIHMPEMDGLEATRVIRKLDNEYAKKIPIIALTAATKESEVRKCVDAGMDDFIVKPMSYDDLIVMVAEYCH